MSDLFDDAVLGAYVDGELSAEQAAAVERLIATNPEARQMVDSIREITLLVRAAAFEGCSRAIRYASHPETSKLKIDR